MPRLPPVLPAPDPALAALTTRIRSLLRGRGTVEEKRMFGALCFMVDGQLCCGLMRRGLLVRLGEEEAARRLEESGYLPMDLTGKQLRAFVIVDEELLREEQTVRELLEQSLRYLSARPPAPPRRVPRG